MKNTIIWFAALLALPCLADKSYSWNSPEKVAQWAKHPYQCAAEARADGCLSVVCKRFDPSVSSGKLRLQATANQVFVFQAKAAASGTGVLFWVPSSAKGPMPQWSVSFRWEGDNQWHEYRIRPFWQGAESLQKLRLDFPNSAPSNSLFLIKDIRIEETAEKPISYSAKEYVGVRFDITAKADGFSAVCWVNQKSSGVSERPFRFIGDQRKHTLFLNLSAEKEWREKIVWLEIKKSKDAKIENLQFCKIEPDLAPDLLIRNARTENAINRVNEKIPLQIFVENLGTRAAKNLSISALPLPGGVNVLNAHQLANLGDVNGHEKTFLSVLLQSDSPCTFEARLRLKVDGLDPIFMAIPVEITPSLNLPKASYVPRPEPVKTPYLISSFYYPGWNFPYAWQKIRQGTPERKPMLGWYDEANPEVVDWQIKWAVENGISCFFVDWYWYHGDLHNEHWIEAFQKARYRSYLKWAVMWANHTGPNTHSMEDQREVTRFWIKNYFSMPEYLKYKGMPVVMIWSPENMERDLGPGGCKKLLDISRKMAMDAGYKGIWFLTMKWPEDSCAPADVQRYKDYGFDMTSIYHYMGHGDRAESKNRYSYQVVAEANPGHWARLAKTGILPFLMNLSTGWDDRPWHGDKSTEIYGKSVPLFRQVCTEAKRFADQKGYRWLMLSPLNEWGEGSYAEPNSEFGFGFYETVREVFCEKPAEGWPVNYMPRDVGLGPYDLKIPDPPRLMDSWDFTGENTDGWVPSMGIINFRKTPEGVAFTTSTRDPIMEADLVPLHAVTYRAIEVRMKVSKAAGKCQIFWAGPKFSEAASERLPLIGDGQFHTYLFPLDKNPMWKGTIRLLRLDPGDQKKTDVVISSIRLVPKKQK